MTLGTGILWLMEKSLSLQENCRLAIEVFRRDFAVFPEYVHLNRVDMAEAEADRAKSGLQVSGEDVVGCERTLCGLPVSAKVDTLQGHLFVGAKFFGEVHS